MPLDIAALPATYLSDARGPAMLVSTGTHAEKILVPAGRRAVAVMLEGRFAGQAVPLAEGPHIYGGLVRPVYVEVDPATAFRRPRWPWPWSRPLLSVWRHPGGVAVEAWTQGRFVFRRRHLVAWSGRLPKPGRLAGRGVVGYSGWSAYTFVDGVRQVIHRHGG